MEDLKAYIESGLLELYVMGDLSQDERHEVELMLAKHPELRKEVEEIERALNIYAEKHAIAPDDNLRERVLGALDYSEKETANPVSVPVIRSVNYYKYAFAASVALLLLSLVALINLNNRLQESNSRIALLEISNQKFSNRVNYINRELNDANQALEVFQNPDQYKLVQLNGLPKAPDAKMVVAFSPEKEVVMIDVASMNMPSHDKEHQYQLWALVDGKPVDLGVFDAAPDSTGMIKMKSLKNAQAFAVTLEPRGGSTSPTLDQMMVMGRI